jgi:hypothetical protein
LLSRVDSNSLAAGAGVAFLVESTATVSVAGAGVVAFAAGATVAVFVVVVSLTGVAGSAARANVVNNREIKMFFSYLVS